MFRGPDGAVLCSRAPHIPAGSLAVGVHRAGCVHGRVGQALHALLTPTLVIFSSSSVGEPAGPAVLVLS